MMKSNLPLGVFFVLLPFLYLATIYGGLPDTVPIHFDWRGIPDSYGPKAMLWLIPGITIPLVMIIIAAMARKIDQGEAPEKQRILGIVTLAFVSLLMCYILYGVKSGGPLGLGPLAILMGIFFAAIGNYLPVLRPNKLMGIRLPRTLNNERIWTKTHRFAGPVFMMAGLLLVVVGLFLKGGAVFIAMMAIILVASLIPVVYAYRLPEDDGNGLV